MKAVFAEGSSTPGKCLLTLLLLRMAYVHCQIFNTFPHLTPCSGRNSSLKTQENLDMVQSLPTDRIMIETGMRAGCGNKAVHVHNILCAQHDIGPLDAITLETVLLMANDEHR